MADTIEPNEIAAKLRVAAEQAVSSLKVTLGNADFARIIRDSDSTMSIEQRIAQAQMRATEIAKAVLEQPRNLFDATSAAAAAASGGHGWLGSGLYGALRVAGGNRGDDRNGDSRDGTSARFDVVKLNGNWGSPEGLAYMRDFAMKNGLGWAANNPDLLRLGPEAIRTLAEANFKRESYRKLADEAKFRAKDIVTLADYAKKHGKEANTLATTVTDANKALATDQHGHIDPKLLGTLRDAETAHMAHPENPVAKHNFENTLDDIEKKDRSKKPHADKLRKEFGLQTKLENAANAKADRKENKAATTDTHKETDYEFLNGPSTAAEPPKSNDAKIKDANAATPPTDGAKKNDEKAAKAADGKKSQLAKAPSAPAGKGPA